MEDRTRSWYDGVRCSVKFGKFLQNQLNVWWGNNPGLSVYVDHLTYILECYTKSPSKDGR